jgi:hypothetical protein
MQSTFQNAASVLSVGIFFTLIIAGLSNTLPESLYVGLTSHGVSAADAQRIAQLPPVSTLFSAFLGYNPVEQLVGSGVLNHLPASDQSALVGREFFPGLISAPFRNGLRIAMNFGIVMSLIAAAASWSRGKHVVAEHTAEELEIEYALADVAEV